MIHEEMRALTENSLLDSRKGDELMNGSGHLNAQL